jgi:hypothetical protein
LSLCASSMDLCEENTALPPWTLVSTFLKALPGQKGAEIGHFDYVGAGDFVATQEKDVRVHQSSSTKM